MEEAERRDGFRRAVAQAQGDDIARSALVRMAESPGDVIPADSLVEGATAGRARVALIPFFEGLRDAGLSSPSHPGILFVQDPYDEIGVTPEQAEIIMEVLSRV